MGNKVISDYLQRLARWVQLNVRLRRNRYRTAGGSDRIIGPKAASRIFKKSQSRFPKLSGDPVATARGSVATFTFNNTLARVSSSALLLAAIMLTCLTTTAQQPTSTPQTPVNGDGKTAKATQQKNSPPLTDSNPFSTSLDDHYRIGPGDVLDIRIVNRPNISRENVRVEGNGTIRMPLIEGSIQAACLTESELAKEITNRYLKFYRNPEVEVFIKDYRSTQVAIIGQVNEQGRFLLQRRIRLLELLSFAKGPIVDKAGQTINVVHSNSAFKCRKTDDQEDVAKGMSSYKLSETLLGEDKANPYLENGDIVTLPEADQVYVVGNVISPRSIPLKEPISLTRAIAMAGGVGKDTKKDKVRVVRQEPGSATKKEIFVDLAAIEKKKAEDVALVPNDIVDVPTSAGKSLLHSLLGTVAPTVSQLPIRVIP
jgi:polysaccharide biosynthesis/export protein